MKTDLAAKWHLETLCRIFRPKMPFCLAARNNPAKIYFSDKNGQDGKSGDKTGVILINKFLVANQKSKTLITLYSTLGPGNYRPFARDFRRFQGVRRDAN